MGSSILTTLYKGKIVVAVSGLLHTVDKICFYLRYLYALSLNIFLRGQFF
jgi:hypothetical protein